MANENVPIDESKPAKQVGDWKRRALIPLMPLAVPGVLIAFAAIFLIIAVCLPFLAVKGFFRQRTFVTQLKSKDRFVTLSHLRPKLEVGEGTLIEEWGVKGPYRIWWTSENVAARGTPPTDEDFRSIMGGKDHVFNDQCVKDYLEPDTGRAILTDIKPRVSRNGGLKTLFPGVQVVMLVATGKQNEIKIVAILPESAIKIANLTDRSVNLNGWRVFDGRANNELRLTGEVAAGGNLVVSFASSKVSFNVNGGDLTLRSAEGRWHTVCYTKEQVRRGEWVEVG